MLICPKCQIEYEEGKKFCKNCGNPLTPKREVIAKQEEIESIPVCKLTCSSCKSIYESGKFCRRCGSPLTLEASSEEKEVIKAPPTETRREVPQIEIPEKKTFAEADKKLICPNCKISYEAGKFCKKCGSALVEETPLPPKEELEATIKPEIKKDVPKLEVPIKEGVKISEKAEIKREPPPVKILEEPAIKILPVKKDEKVRISKARGKFLRPLPIAIVGIIFLLAIGEYFLWPKYSYLIKKKPPATAEVSKESTSVTPSPQPSVPVPTDKEENETIAIKNLLENIRQANLQKNIDLFMSWYSVDFKDREGRKNSMLENWQNFDYLDLSYDLKSQAISGDTANAKVEWVIKFSPKSGGQTQETRSFLDVTFKKEEGLWKIKEIKPVS